MPGLVLQCKTLEIDYPSSEIEKGQLQGLSKDTHSNEKQGSFKSDTKTALPLPLPLPSWFRKLAIEIPDKKCSLIKNLMIRIETAINMKERQFHENHC